MLDRKKCKAVNGDCFTPDPLVLSMASGSLLLNKEALNALPKYESPTFCKLWAKKCRGFQGANLSIFAKLCMII